MSRVILLHNRFCLRSIKKTNIINLDGPYNLIQPKVNVYIAFNYKQTVQLVLLGALPEVQSISEKGTYTFLWFIH